MALLHYIDNEVPWGEGVPPAHYGEWDSRTESGSSGVSRSAEAAFPERGFSKHGLTVHAVAAGDCYMRKDLPAETSPLTFGFWLKIPSAPTWSSGDYIELSRGKNATNGTTSWRVYLYNDGGTIQLCAEVYAAGASSTAYGGTLVTGRWYYVALDCEWTVAHGRVQLYLDGVAVLTAEKVADASTNKPEYVQLGSDWCSAGVEATYYVDEAKVRDDDTYPEPYVPTPSSDYLCPERTMVLWRGASDDSRQFADYCVSELGIPRCNLLRLDSATADETLADYATFLIQIENPITSYRVTNPTVSTNIRCFLLGYGVPGYFMEGGVKHSATSRLMNFATAFSSGAANPLYNPDPVVRLGSGDLGGKHFATRIDADTLAHAKDIIDAGLAFFETALAELADADKLYSDDATYLASLNCQHLRCLTSALSTYSADAFVWGDTSDPTFGDAGSRACFADTSASSADTLRATTSACAEALIDAGYAAALGSSETAPSESFDADSFFEMLRIGGTLAEAFAVAIAKLDYTSVAVGVPFMTVAFQPGGYNLYRGIGGPEHMDWENPVTYARSDQQTVSLAQTLVPGQHYLYAVRVVSKAGLVERNTHVLTYVGVDEEGYLLPPPLARPSDLEATVLTDGALVIGFSYLRQLGFTEADGFDVLSDHGTGQLDLESPIASIDQVRPGQWDFEVSISRPSASMQLAVRARSGERVGPLSEVLFVPLSCPPALAKVL